MCPPFNLAHPVLQSDHDRHKQFHDCIKMFMHEITNERMIIGSWWDFAITGHPSDDAELLLSDIPIR